MDKQTIIKHLKSISSKKVADSTKSFFKTNKGEYSYGDIFLGIKVAQIRKSVKKFSETPLDEIEMLLDSKYHEVRHFGVLFLVDKFLKGDKNQKEKVFKIYLKNTKHINNWDLVDCSAHHIVGSQLHGKKRDILYDLAKSKHLWERRISIVSTFYYIKLGEFEDTLKIAEILLDDQEDLINKAVGWMLREVGKKDHKRLKSFLEQNHHNMARVTLRYAIERFCEDERKYYLNL